MEMIIEKIFFSHGFTKNITSPTLNQIFRIYSTQIFLFLLLVLIVTDIICIFGDNHEKLSNRNSLLFNPGNLHAYFHMG